MFRDDNFNNILINVQGELYNSCIQTDNSNINSIIIDDLIINSL